MAAAVSFFYDIPIFIWGTNLPKVIVDEEASNNMCTLLPTNEIIIMAFKEVMKQFKWSEFALLTTKSSACKTARCLSLSEEIEKVQAKIANNLSLTYKHSLRSGPTDVSVLKTVGKYARIIVVCTESDRDRREMLKNAMLAGMDTDEYVIIFLESRHSGFGEIPIWVDTSSEPDGMDNVIEAMSKRVLILDGSSKNGSNSDFGQAVISRVHEHPFYCDNECDDSNLVSYGATFLADALYIYATSIGRLLQENSSAPLLHGRDIIRNTEGEYEGFSGNLSLNYKGEAKLLYQLYAINAFGQPQAFVKISGDANGVLWEPLYTDENSMLWATRNGGRPLSRPKCGFQGTDCQPSFWEAQLPLIISTLSIFLIAFLFIVIALIYFLRELEKLEKFEVSDERMSEVRRYSTNSNVSIYKSEESEFSFCLYNGEKALLKKFDGRPHLKAKDLAELRMMVKLDNEKLHKFHGFCIDGPRYMAVWGFCKKGSLRSLIADSAITFDSYIITSTLKQVAEGLHAIHHMPIGYHGRLTSSVCLVDEHYRVRISDFGLNFITTFENLNEKTLLSTAPELLRRNDNIGTKEGDIYSFAIISSEVVTRKSAFDIDNCEESPEELSLKVKRGGPCPFRPTIEEADICCSSELVNLIYECWAEEPNSRPKIRMVVRKITALAPKGSLIDHIYKLLENRAADLEESVRERTAELMEEKKKCNILLKKMLPRQVVEKLMVGERIEPETFESVTIFFCDVVEFTTLASQCTPLQVINLMSALYTTFDTVIDEHHVYKVETIGDAYFCVSGLPERNGNQHAKDIAEMAFGFLMETQTFIVPHLPAERINIRIGIHTGPCVAGVIGLSMQRYCLFGDTIDVASAMKNQGKPGSIHISHETNRYLTEIIGGYRSVCRGEVIVKDLGSIESYWLLPP